MTLEELVRQTFNTLGISEGNRVMENNIKMYVNKAYLDIALNKYPLYQEDIVAVTDNKFNVNDLTETLYRIKEITDTNHTITIPWSTTDNNTFTVANFGGYNVSVLYQYIPRELLVDSDEPLIPQQYHNILPLYAQSELLRSMNRIQEAQVAGTLYEQQKSYIRRWTGEQNKFINWW